MLLPFALLFGNGVSSSASPPESISGYYYTDMRSFLVAGLCALGVLLMVYRGYRTMDGVLTNVAGSCVILVALFPTKPPLAVRQHFTSQQNVLGDLHVVFAAVAFIALGVMALRFAVTRPVSEVVIHRVCAGMIFSSVLLACLCELDPCGRRAAVRHRGDCHVLFRSFLVYFRASGQGRGVAVHDVARCCQRNEGHGRGPNPYESFRWRELLAPAETGAD